MRPVDYQRAEATEAGGDLVLVDVWRQAADEDLPGEPLAGLGALAVRRRPGRRGDALGLREAGRLCEHGDGLLQERTGVLQVRVVGLAVDGAGELRRCPVAVYLGERLQCVGIAVKESFGRLAGAEDACGVVPGHEGGGVLRHRHGHGRLGRRRGAERSEHHRGLAAHSHTKTTRGFTITIIFFSDKSRLELKCVTNKIFKKTITNIFLASFFFCGFTHVQHGTLK